MKADGKGSVVLGGFQGLDKNPFGSVPKGPKQPENHLYQKSASICIENHATKSSETPINKGLPRDSDSTNEKSPCICSERRYTKSSETALNKGISKD